MNCPNCHELAEDGAAYCGNCGQLLKKSRALGAVGLRGITPSYALALPAQHVGETQALMSLLCGITGLAGTLFIPVIGLALGTAGLVLGTISRIYTKRTMHFMGLLLSSLAILASLAAWAHATRNDPRTNPALTRAAPASQDIKISAGLSTPCYSLNFIDELNISNKDNSCTINAFNGKTIDTSTNAYKIYASEAEVGSVNDFTNLAKAAVEKDIAKSVPDFKINSQKASTFAGSPAYMITVSNGGEQVSIVEAVILHEVPNGNNVFVIVHANNGTTADLQILESQWQWK